MSPALLIVGGALVALIGGLWSRPTAARGSWRAGAALAVCISALGAWVQQPAGEIGAPVVSTANQDQLPVRTTVVLNGAQGRRQVRVVRLSQPVPGGTSALWAMLALGLAGVLGQLGRPGSGGRAQLASALPALAGVGGAVIWLSAGGVEQGEAAIRGFLAGVDNITGFTVPEGTWQYRVAGAPAVIAAGAAGVLGAVSHLGRANVAFTRLIPAGAALAAVGVAWQIQSVGGIPWRPSTACAWVAALALSGAWLLRDEDSHAALLTGAAVAMAALALS